MTATRTTPEVLGAPNNKRPRPRIMFLIAGLILAAVLVAILFGTRGGSGPSPQAAEVAPGVDQPTAALLSLDVNPPQWQRSVPDFTLTDQDGRPFSLSQFRGKSVVLSFNDDECPDLCTLLAEDILVANRDLGRAASDVAFVSVNANPFYPEVGAVKAWTHSHGLGSLSNWYFGTSSPQVLQSIWHDYGVFVQLDQKDRTVTHGAQIFFIDPAGHQRAIGDFEMASANTAYFGHAMARMAADLLPGGGSLAVGGPATPAPLAGNVTVGAEAPSFNLARLGSRLGAISLAALRGKPTVLNFWASSCAACRAELPSLEAAYRSFGGKVNFVGIDVADRPSAALAMARAAGVGYPLVTDPSGTVAGRYRISGTPYSVILGPDGTIKVLHPEAFTTEQVEYVLESYYPNLSPPGS